MGEFRTEEEIRLTNIEAVIKALGTMVIFPSYDSDPNMIGSKIFTGPIQQPILLDKDRKIATDKLVELISQL